MKKLSRKSLVAIALVVAIGASLAIGGTLAYFTDTTDKKDNVFTLGNVDIDLAEPKWDEYTKENGDNRVFTPGAEYDKDPTITVADDSQNCWLFVDLELTRYVPIFQYLKETGKIQDGDTLIQQSIALTGAFLDGFENADWEIMNADEIAAMVSGHTTGSAWDSSVTIRLGYKGSDPGYAGILSAGDQVVMFNKVIVPTDLTQENASLFYVNSNGTPQSTGADNKIRLSVKAYAIQADGLDTLADAYAAMFPATTPAP